MVRTIEDSELTVTAAALHPPVAHDVHDKTGLCRFIFCTNNIDFLTGLFPGPKFLRMPAAVVRNHFVGRSQNCVRRPVVLLQPHDFCAGKMVFKAQDISNIRATPAIDRLIVITDRTDIAMLRRQHGHQLELDRVGILILVNKEILVAPAMLLKHVRELTPQRNDQQQQVIKVDHVHGFQTRLVAAIDIGQRSRPHGVGRINVRRREQAGLGNADVIEEIAVTQLPARHPLFAQDIAHQPNLITFRGNIEVRTVSQVADFRAQQSHAERVKCRGADAPGIVPGQEMGQPLLHFASRFVGEGDSQNLLRWHSLRNEVGNPVGDDPRLAGAGTGKQQKGPLDCAHSFSLLRIQRLEFNHLFQYTRAPRR